MIKQVRKQIKQCLYDLSARPETPTHINNIYTIEDSTCVRPGVRLLRATLLDWNEPRNLMVYDLSVDPLSSRDELRLFYLREFKALKDLHATGYVPEVKDPFAWSDDFFVLPIVPPGGKSLSAYSPPTSSKKLINEVSMAAEAFRGLAKIHQHHIIHRAINPGTIFIEQMSPPFRLMFSHFFAARVTTAPSIYVSLDALEIEDPYIAPELREGYGLAQAQSDVFSLALILLKRWSGQQLKVLRSNIVERVVLPDLQARWPALPTESIARLTELFGTIFHAPSIALRPLPSAVAEELEEIAHALEQ
jgi:serine/threonine protein kinase